VVSVSLVYDLKSRVVTVDGAVYSSVELVEIHRVGVSGVVDLDGDSASLRFSQPIAVETARANGGVALRVGAPPSRRRRRSRAAELAEAWHPGAAVSALVERARGLLEPALLPRKKYAFPSALKVAYDGALHEVTVLYLEYPWVGLERIKRKLSRVVLSELSAPDLYVEIRPAVYRLFVRTSQGCLTAISYEKPFSAVIAGREAALGP
jgi:hypothetical protein